MEEPDGLPRLSAKDVTDRILGIIANLKVSDIAEASIYAGLAYVGYDRLPPVFPDSIRLLWGPVALKLATSSGDASAKLAWGAVEIPVNSQMAGLAMLAMLGFSCLPWDNLKKEAAQIAVTKEIGQDIKTTGDMETSMRPLTEDEQRELDRLRSTVASLMMQIIYANVNEREALILSLETAQTVYDAFVLSHQMQEPGTDGAQ